MSTIIHMIESERKMFINDEHWLPNEIKYHINLYGEYCRSERKGMMVNLLIVRIEKISDKLEKEITDLMKPNNIVDREKTIRLYHAITGWM